MTGLHAPDFIRFIIQLGIAVAGAASLWGGVFALKSMYGRDGLFQKFSELLVWLFIVAFVVFVVSWWTAALAFFVPEVSAHEGITLKPEISDVIAGFSINFPLVFLFMLVGAAHVHLFFYYRKRWQEYAHLLWFALFGIASAILALSVFIGELGRAQIYFSFHNWHSVLTLGSVIVVDYLFLATFRMHSHKVSLYSFFPIISLFIWIGLGLDFASNALVFEDAFRVTAQFLFIQTVIAIIIINGALLSGKINAILLDFAKRGTHTFSDLALKRVIGVSGSVSIVSWLTITFVDFFEFTLRYWQFIGVYLAAIMTAYFVHSIIEMRLTADESR